MKRLSNSNTIPQSGNTFRPKEADDAVLIQHLQSEGLIIVPLKVVRGTRNKSASPTSHSLSCLSESCNSRGGHLHHLGFSCEEQQKEGGRIVLRCESRTGLVLKPHSALATWGSYRHPTSSLGPLLNPLERSSFQARFSQLVRPP